jgi:hypothetical protein
MVVSPDDLLPDHGPSAARQALAAAAGLRVFDGRATCWLVLQRVLEITALALLLGAAVYGFLMGAVWVMLTLCTAGVAAALVGYEGTVGRLAGAEPRRWRTRWRVLVVLAAATVILLPEFGAFGPWSSAATGLVVAGGYLVTPVLRWATTRRRPRATTGWPDGAQAFAVLSVLARAQWVHPDRLSQLTGLPRDRCDDWVRACAVRGLAVPAARGRVLLHRPEITAAGLVRLDVWTSELTRRAAGAQPWTASTAPTSAEVSSDRSSSEVT